MLPSASLWEIIIPGEAGGFSYAGKALWNTGRALAGAYTANCTGLFPTALLRAAPFPAAPQRAVIFSNHRQSFPRWKIKIRKSKGAGTRDRG